MDKLQAILQVSQIIVVDADRAAEQQLCRAFQQCRESFHFISANQLEESILNGEYSNPFIILNLESEAKLNSISKKIDFNKYRLILMENVDNKVPNDLKNNFYLLNTSDIGISFLQFWEKALGSILSSELNMAKSENSFQTLERTLELPDGNSEARARLSFALATQLTVDLDLIGRIIRLALFYPLIAIENWQELASRSSAIRQILPLLEQKLLLGKIPLASSCPQDLSIELLVVECALFAQKHIGESEKVFRAELKQFSAQLPFKVRTQIRNGAERCFKYLWRENEAA